MQPELASLLDDVKARQGLIVCLTGAGISAESGIPTFRGPEGYWTVGSEVYRPEDMATYSMFRRQPREVWSWYLFRRSTCQAAEPNAAHLALVDLERRIGDRFLLVTQNVDGLHLRAGQSRERTYEIHGNIDFTRCARPCNSRLRPIPEGLRDQGENDELDSDQVSALHCPDCGDWLRPHVLWFDECYDEEHFRFESSIAAATTCDLMLVVGTAGATNLPLQMGQLAASSDSAIIDINPTDNPFAQFASTIPRGIALRGPAGKLVPEIVEGLSIESP